MLQTSQSLPLSQMPLDDYLLVKISGSDSSKYLQGQLTADMNKLNENHWRFAVQCDPKGKVLCNMLLFKRGDDIYYIVRKSVLDIQLKELKKYAIFSKITFEIDSSLSMIGIAGDLNTVSLPKFEEAQNCLNQNDITYLKLDLPNTRYIVIAPQTELAHHFSTLKRATNEQWQLLNMQANYPIIDQPLMSKHLPQAFNLQNIDAISFDKGCYCGQEMVAIAQYRGINKRALYLLVGSSDLLPQIGDSLEQQMGENWRETGSVLSVLNVDDETVWIQAILNNDLTEDSLFRVKGETDSHLTIQSLPLPVNQ